MQDLKRIRIMTNLAIYDKHHGQEDRKITSHYRADYVYKKNLGIRVGVFLGTAVMVMVYYGYKLFVAETDIFVLFNKAEAIKIGLVVLILMAVYTIIGTVINRARYSLAEERCERYEKMLAKLNGKSDENITD